MRNSKHYCFPDFGVLIWNQEILQKYGTYLLRLSLSYLVQFVGNQSKEYFKMMEFTSTIMVQTKSLSKFIIESEVLPEDFSNEN